MVPYKKICVLQTDNRPSLDYLLKTQEVNKKFCDKLNYDYVFIEMDNTTYGTIHPATKKIYIVNNFLQTTAYDIIVFLDSDAWIQNGYLLDTILTNLIHNERKQGCFSRDPYVKRDTFINSGSFIIKNNVFTKQLYNNIMNELHTDNTYHNIWPYDQYYISNSIFENREHFVIFVPDILNTPKGKVLRHNWCKNEVMFHDLRNLLCDLHNEVRFDTVPFVETDYYDDKEFPNTSEVGYYYID